MVCVLVNESGRDSWACRLTGGSQHPLKRNYSETPMACQSWRPGTAPEAAGHVIVFAREVVISPAEIPEVGDCPMHTHSVDQHMHDHVFLGDKHAENERRTWFVVALTLVMMVGEIAAGSFFGSMALLADGWHMGTHAAALGIAGAASLFARRESGNGRVSLC